jgi:hypothetical protein
VSQIELYTLFPVRVKDARDARPARVGTNNFRAYAHTTIYPRVGTKIVIVVQSGSMRTGDVPGYRSRTDAVYGSLLRDLVLPQLKQG